MWDSRDVQILESSPCKPIGTIDEGKLLMEILRRGPAESWFRHPKRNWVSRRKQAKHARCLLVDRLENRLFWRILDHGAPTASTAGTSPDGISRSDVSWRARMDPSSLADKRSAFSVLNLNLQRFTPRASPGTALYRSDGRKWPRRARGRTRESAASRSTSAPDCRIFPGGLEQSSL